MAGRLQVDPVLLHRSADEMDRLLAAHRAAHTKAHAMISAAASGLVGDAAAALSNESPEWQGHSHYVVNESLHFRDAFDGIGYAIANADEQTAVNMLTTRLPQTGA